MEKSYESIVDRIRVVEESSDGSVTARYAPADGVKLRIDPRALIRHTSDSLSIEITQVVNQIMARVGRAHDEIHRRRWGVDAGSSRTESGSLPKGSDPVVTRYSPRKFAKVTISDGESVRISLRPDAIGRMDLTPEALTSEVNSALMEGVKAFVGQRLHGCR